MYLGATGISIRVACKAWISSYLTVAWLFPPGARGWMGLANVTLGESVSLYPSPPDGQLKEVTDRWADTCIALPYGTMLSSRAARGKTFDYDVAAGHIDQLEQMLTEIIPTLATLPPPD